MSVLIIAEHNNQQLNPATLHAVTAAAKLGEVHILVAGHNAADVVESAKKINGVTKVLLADAPHYGNALAEEITPLVVNLAGDYRYISATATAFGKNLLPRIAALLDAPQISDLTEVVDFKTFVRPIYAGNAFETIQSDAPKLVLTFRATSFDAAENGGNAEVQTIEAAPAQNLSRFVKQGFIQSERPELTQAKVVVAGGRALGSAEQFNAILTPLADIFGAAIGASRAAVDAEYAPNDAQVGQTGKVVAPQLYFAIGISGAIQHTAGIQDSKVIVAINKDPDAPIFNVSDYGIVGDLFDVVPQLTTALKSQAKCFT
ncbi:MULTISPECIES: electron transfer flavoprotein subunit alpha/FixB family protein [unclassified Neisseria]|uniref:electron transfer flavoprotein subunit alpha/FixB family protein n=1 Tax=unclassified Neisseria TaxID=2623750 RepID=UPI001072BCD2|nr:MULTISPECIES: electron transfer flavoprotein subunit alpha/FixB family protein [unclassified Neisseria]MBF0804957.1 electron transfer flavoprotein subunit alpha/FixB family protein [Neisseria sp. 19428wB4_WF04]TFU39319.1 electron transfer flavoprotein subunit alpha/FixB family protein [Neisseria sp. WF04]